MLSRVLGLGLGLGLAACEVSAVPAPASAPPPPSPGASAPPSADPHAPDRCAPLARGNWTLSWSAVVSRETLLGGRPSRVLGPAPGAHRVLRDADTTPPAADSMGMGSGSKGDLATLFDATTIPLNVGEIVVREIPGDRVATACVTGGSARAYWTHAHDKVRSEGARTSRERSATLYVEGVTAGESTLVLCLEDGAARSIPLVVTEPPPKAP
jgi:hypothetical protein